MSRANHCESCRRPFGMMLVKHECPSCADSVCQFCSAFKVAIPDLTGTSDPVPVCEKCFKIETGEKVPCAKCGFTVSLYLGFCESCGERVKNAKVFQVPASNPVCPYCNFRQRRVDYEFCENCGSGRTHGDWVACPLCGVRQNPHNAFCGQCGYAIRPQTQQEAETEELSRPTSDDGDDVHYQRRIQEAAETARRQAEEEERRRVAAELEARRRREAEEREKREMAEREQREKKLREEAEKRRREAEQARVKVEQAAIAADARRREREEAERRQREEEERKRREKEEAEARKRKQKEEEEEKKRREKEEEERRKKAEVEIKRKADEAAAAAKKKAEQELQKKKEQQKAAAASANPARQQESKTGPADDGSSWLESLSAEDKGLELKARKRIDDAIRWVDKELRKLVAEIQKHGKGNGIGTTITFGHLFEKTQDVFEALSGTLMTAKKRKVVSYDGSLLLQKVNDDVVITLTQTKVEDTPLPDHDKIRKQAGPKKDFFNAPKTDGPEMCHTCGKSVYMAERLGVGTKVYHKACFRCHQCKKLLKATEYNVDPAGKIWCPPHYNQMFQASGGRYDM